MNARFNQGELDKILSSLIVVCNDLLTEDDRIIGIQHGGVLLAQFLNRKLARPHPIGQLDVNYYRDDFGHHQRKKIVAPSVDLPDLNGARVLLVDDVLWTGRTVRAALNELFDYGRPQQISLLVLFDRSGRELPIEASVVGQSIELDAQQQIKLFGEADQLYAEISEFAKLPAPDRKPL